MSDPLDDEPTGDAVPRDDLFPEQELPETTERRQLTARGAAIVSARVVAGLVGIGIAAATVTASALVPWPTLRAQPATVVVQPVPTAQQLVCPGSVLRLADDTGQGATEASALGRPAVRYHASEGVADAVPLAQSDAATGGTAAAPTLVSTPPSAAGGAEPLLSGAQAQQVDAGDFVGLAAADCGVASGDTWLVGGSTEVGRTTLLTLANPTDVAATVDLQLYGPNGLIAAPGTSGIIVAPQGQRVLSLAGFQPGLAAPVVHVTSTGGQVVANLQQAIVRGLQPGGVDILQGAAPSTQTVIPGVVIGDPTGVQALLGRGEAYADVLTTLRLFAPGEGEVPLTVSVIPEDGAATGTSFELEIDAGRVVDLPIEELEPGSYTVRIDAQAPVVAAARVTAAAAEVTDFAWSAAAATLTGSAQLTVAEGPSPVLHLMNPTDTEVTVDVGGTAVTIAAGAAAATPVGAGQTVRLEGFDQLYASISLRDGGAVASYAVHPPGRAAGTITVYP
jgi:hypothetical protein